MFILREHGRPRSIHERYLQKLDSVFKDLLGGATGFDDSRLYWSCSMSNKASVWGFLCISLGMLPRVCEGLCAGAVGWKFWGILGPPLFLNISSTKVRASSEASPRNPPIPAANNLPILDMRTQGYLSKMRASRQPLSLRCASHFSRNVRQHI